MKRICTLCALLLCAIMSLSAQTEVRPYWETSPEFSSEEKDLVINVLDSLPQIKLPHRIYDDLELLQVGSDLLSIKTSLVGQWSMRLLPMPNGTPLLSVIRTVSEPIGDSELQFYTPSWGLVADSSLFVRPGRASFIPQDIPAEDKARLEQLLYPLYLVYRWLPEGGIEVSASSPVLLSDSSRAEDQRLLALIKPKRYRWQGTRFVPNN